MRERVSVAADDDINPIMTLMRQPRSTICGAKGAASSLGALLHAVMLLLVKYRAVLHFIIL